MIVNMTYEIINYAITFSGWAKTLILQQDEVEFVGML